MSGLGCCGMTEVQWQQRIMFTLFFFAAGVFTLGAWPLLSNLEEWQRLAKALPATVLRRKADSTTRLVVGREVGTSRAAAAWGGRYTFCRLRMVN